MITSALLPTRKTPQAPERHFEKITDIANTETCQAPDWISWFPNDDVALWGLFRSVNQIGSVNWKQVHYYQHGKPPKLQGVILRKLPTSQTRKHGKMQIEFLGFRTMMSRYGVTFEVLTKLEVLIENKFILANTENPSSSRASLRENYRHRKHGNMSSSRLNFLVSERWNCPMKSLSILNLIGSVNWKQLRSCQQRTHVKLQNWLWENNRHRKHRKTSSSSAQWWRNYHFFSLSTLTSSRWTRYFKFFWLLRFF